MNDHVPWIRIALAAVMGAGTAIWGWFGWLVIAWAAAMALDYISGSVAAARAGEWSSDKARAGLFHKLGMILAVLVAILLDALIGLIIRATEIQLPFTYTVLISALVLAWYAFTELGSILENAVKLGAPVPSWLRKILQVGKASIDAAGQQITEKKGGAQDAQSDGNKQD